MTPVRSLAHPIRSHHGVKRQPPSPQQSGGVAYQPPQRHYLPYSGASSSTPLASRPASSPQQQVLLQRGREYWAVYLTSPQSFIIAFSYLLALQHLGILLNFDWCQHFGTRNLSLFINLTSIVLSL